MTAGWLIDRLTGLDWPADWLPTVQPMVLVLMLRLMLMTDDDTTDRQTAALHRIAADLLLAVAGSREESHLLCIVASAPAVFRQ